MEKKLYDKRDAFISKKICYLHCWNTFSRDSKNPTIPENISQIE